MPPTPIALSSRTTRPPAALEGLAPLDALAHLAATTAGDIALLHSGPAEGYSVLAFDPLARASADSAGTPAFWTAVSDGTNSAHAGLSPLQALEKAVGGQALAFEPPHPLVGWIGFVSYDIAHTLERLPRFAPDDLRWPLVHFTLFRHYLVFDKSTGGVTGISLGPDGDGAAGPDAFAPFAGLRPQPVPAAGRAAVIAAEPREAYLRKIRRVQAYIAAGDIYQANLAQRWVVDTPDAPCDIFRRLCAASPAPYSAYLRFTTPAGGGGGMTRHVASASPELLLAVADGHAVTRPIKGTRPRDLQDLSRDLALRDDLLASAKDAAELAMIVDLLRNDLGRVARFGTVRVTQPRQVEQHPTVWHTAATVEADLRADVTLADLLGALCPGGSITGAPKIRAMQILEELEGGGGGGEGASPSVPAERGFRRALYCGNIGVIGPQTVGRPVGGVALNIAIRTIVLQDGRAYLSAGGGVVADSDPAAEYDETVHKAVALFRALGLAPPL
jgi:para-aminobenzoate synthetase component 1